MMYLTKDGFIYRAVPNIVNRKNKRGNWHEQQEGYKPDGCPPLMRVVFHDVATRRNPALDAIRATGQLIEEE